jgi:hypothetical protein
MFGYKTARYIRYAEIAIVLVLGGVALWTWRELTSLRKTPVMLPNYEFEVTGPPEAQVVQTRGTWIPAERVPEPLQTTTIECKKASMRCVESAAQVVFVDGRGVLEATQTEFEVDRWTDKEVVTKVLEGRCGTRVLSFDLAQKRAKSKVSASIPKSTCREAPERSLDLVAGYKVRPD